MKRCCTGGNGKQIFGDAWWLEPEEDARLAAELAGAHAQAMPQSAFGASKAPVSAQGDVMRLCIFPDFLAPAKENSFLTFHSWFCLLTPWSAAGAQGTTTPLSALSFDMGPTMAAINGSLHGSDVAAMVWHCTLCFRASQSISLLGMNKISHAQLM